jgi:hypothetical protein
MSEDAASVAASASVLQRDLDSFARHGGLGQGEVEIKLATVSVVCHREALINTAYFEALFSFRSAASADSREGSSTAVSLNLSFRGVEPILRFIYASAFVDAEAATRNFEGRLYATNVQDVLDAAHFLGQVTLLCGPIET